MKYCDSCSLLYTKDWTMQACWCFNVFDSLAQMRFTFPEPSEGVSDQRPSIQMLTGDVDLSRLLLKWLVLRAEQLLLKVGASGTQWGRSPLLFKSRRPLSPNTFCTNTVSHRSTCQFRAVIVGIHGRGKVHHVSLGSVWMGALFSGDMSICLMCPFGAVVPLWSNLILKKLAGRNTSVRSADTLGWSHTEQTKLRSPPEMLDYHDTWVLPTWGLLHTRACMHARTCWYTVPVQPLQLMSLAGISNLSSVVTTERLWRALISIIKAN